MRQFIYPYILLEDTFEAANYYKDMFNGEITYIMRGKDTPDCPEDKLESVMHLQLKFNDNQIYMADQKLPRKSNIELHLDYESKEELIEVFNRFKAESKVVRDIEETFWGALFGVLIDKYGITWQFHYTIPTK